MSVTKPITHWASMAPSGQIWLDLAGMDDAARQNLSAVEDGWLWILGSHACTRAKLTKNDDDIIDLAELAAMRPMPARAVVARAPLVDDAQGYALPVARDGDRVAGLVKQTTNGNRLAVALARHPLLGKFVGIPAKEGGVDIEGIAVAGDRIALGLRGPTLGGHAAILETKVRPKRSGRLKMVGELSVRLLALEGLAVRDLKRDGDDLLILRGPTTAVSGPCSLWRWRGWVGDPPRDLAKVRLHRPDWIMDIPHGRGNDNPKGLALFGEPERGVVILLDSPLPSRFEGTRLSIDFFALPTLA